MNKPLWFLPKGFAQLLDLPLSWSMAQLPIIAGKKDDQHQKLVFPVSRELVGSKFGFEMYAKSLFYSEHSISHVLQHCPVGVLRDTII